MSLTFTTLLYYMANYDKSVYDALVAGSTCAMECGTMVKIEPGWAPDDTILGEWVYVRPPGEGHVFIHDTICLGRYFGRNDDN